MPNKIKMSSSASPLLDAATMLTYKVPESYWTQFYYTSASDIIILSKDSSGVWHVYVPSISDVKNIEAIPAVEAQLDTIEAAYQVAKIRANEEFIYDLRAKTIIDRDSFADFPPIIGTEKCLFILLDENDKWDGVVYYLQNREPEHALAALSLFFAKMRLHRPKLKNDWTNEGKLLLNFLLAHEYYKKCRFADIRGAWQHITFNFSRSGPHKLNVEIDKVKIDRALTLQKNVDSLRTKAAQKKLRNQHVIQAANSTPLLPAQSDFFGDSDFTEDGVEDPFLESVGLTGDHDWRRGAIDGHVMLSDVVHEGISKFYGRGYLAVHIDMMNNVFKEISIDGRDEIVFVALQNNCSMVEDEIKEALNARDVIVLDSIGDI